MRDRLRKSHLGIVLSLSVVTTLALLSTCSSMNGQHSHQAGEVIILMIVLGAGTACAGLAVLGATAEPNSVLASVAVIGSALLALGSAMLALAGYEWPRNPSSLGDSSRFDERAELLGAAKHGDFARVKEALLADPALLRPLYSDDPIIQPLLCHPSATPDAELTRLLLRRARPPRALVERAAQCSVATLDSMLAAGVPATKLTNILMTSTRAEVIGTLLDHGASPNAVDADGMTPLMHHRNRKIAQLLLQRGANPRALTPNGRSALHYGKGVTDLAGCYTELLEAGADPNQQEHRYKDTPLLVMAREDRWVQAAADTLVRHGADPLLQDHDGNTVLELLFKFGGDIGPSLHWPSLKLRGPAGERLLKAALAEERSDMVPKLLAAGVRRPR